MQVCFIQKQFAAIELLKFENFTPCKGLGLRQYSKDKFVFHVFLFTSTREDFSYLKFWT